MGNHSRESTPAPDMGREKLKRIAKRTAASVGAAAIVTAVGVSGLASEGIDRAKEAYAKMDTVEVGPELSEQILDTSETIADELETIRGNMAADSDVDVRGGQPDSLYYQSGDTRGELFQAHLEATGDQTTLEASYSSLGDISGSTTEVAYNVTDLAAEHSDITSIMRELSEAPARPLDRVATYSNALEMTGGSAFAFVEVDGQLRVSIGSESTGWDSFNDNADNLQQVSETAQQAVENLQESPYSGIEN